MSAPTFKRAKRIVALHYGSGSFKTRRLCQLFGNPEGLPKNELILREAVRILELRKSLGFEVTNAGIDATMAREVQSQINAHTGRWPKAAMKACVTCKQPITCNGWLADTPTFPACPGDCTMIANFFYTENGAKLSACTSFQSMYGKDAKDLSPDESFEAMLAYMVHLSAHRTQRIQRDAQLRNPTYGIVQANRRSAGRLSKA